MRASSTPIPAAAVACSCRSQFVVGWGMDPGDTVAALCGRRLGDDSPRGPRRAHTRGCIACISGTRSVARALGFGVHGTRVQRV